MPTHNEVQEIQSSQRTTQESLRANDYMPSYHARHRVLALTALPQRLNVLLGFPNDAAGVQVSRDSCKDPGPSAGVHLLNLIPRDETFFLRRAPEEDGINTQGEFLADGAYIRIGSQAAVAADLADFPSYVIVVRDNPLLMMAIGYGYGYGTTVVVEEF
jgi:hypothetical protein